MSPPLDKHSVVIVAVFGVVLPGERLIVQDWLGILLIAAGAMLVAVQRRQREQETNG